jgi:hypothetical protein
MITRHYGYPVYQPNQRGDPFLNKDDRIFLLGEGKGQTLQVLGRVSAHGNYLCTKTQQNGG